MKTQQEYQYDQIEQWAESIANAALRSVNEAVPHITKEPNQYRAQALLERIIEKLEVKV